MMDRISFVTMTYNEEQNLRLCIESVRELADEILVVDSFSADKTVEVAKELGATVIQHPFEGYLEQRNYSIRQAKFPLVLFLDADEWLSDELRGSIEQVKKERTFDCYYMNRRNRIGDTWLWKGSMYPDRKLRLFDKSKVLHEGKNPHDRIVPAKGAKASLLKGDILHNAYKDLHARIQRLNQHSTSAAEYLFNIGEKPSLFRLLIKPYFRFIIEYFLRLGFLDGFYGYCIAKTDAHYVFQRESKLWELWKTQSRGTNR